MSIVRKGEALGVKLESISKIYGQNQNTLLVCPCCLLMWTSVKNIFRNYLDASFVVYITPVAVSRLLPVFFGLFNQEDEVWATILALIWLHGEKMDAEDEWSLLAQKALSWLQATNGMCNSLFKM